MKKISIVMLIAVLAIAVLSVFASAEAADTTFGLEPMAERQTLRLGFFAGSPLSYPFLFADQEGFFDELNIDVEYYTFTNGPAMMEANADWDMAGSGLGGILVGLKNYDIRLIGISDYEENLGLFVRKGSPLIEGSDKAENWKGTEWLYPVGTTAQGVLVAALETVGLGMDDIKSTNMDVASALTGFIGGTGDGLGVWNAMAFSAEDAGFVRIGDAGTLGFKAPCAIYATDKALADPVKREMVQKAYALFYYAWEWAQKNDENWNKSIDYYYENCVDEGIAVTEDIAERVMNWYRAPGLKESIELLTTYSADDTGKYTKREVSQAEKDILMGFDFFISQGKYTPADRDAMLDNVKVDPSIAMEVDEMIQALGLEY